MRNPYLIFDAGGTLVFPDFPYLAQIVSQSGIPFSPGHLFSTHCELIYQLDFQTRQEGVLPDPFPNGYVKALFKDLVNDRIVLSTLADRIDMRNREKSLWAATYPWVSKTLTDLRNLGYRMSVISNSDGRVEEILRDLDLRKYFEQVFDSAIIGISKPDPLLFETALNSLNLRPDEAIYIGDVFYIDVWGSNQAGLGCVHLDPGNLYSDWPGVHIPSITLLPSWLREYNQFPAMFDLFPTRNHSIAY